MSNNRIDLRDVDCDIMWFYYGRCVVIELFVFFIRDLYWLIIYLCIVWCGCGIVMLVIFLVYFLYSVNNWIRCGIIGSEILFR